MRQILAITRKELLLWAEKPGSWIIVFVVPFIFIWIMQAVFGSSGTPVVTVYAVDQDRGAEAARVMEALRSTDNLKIEELKTREEAARKVGEGEHMAAIIVPPGFSLNLRSPEGAKIEVIIDPARAEQANIVIGLANAALAPIMVDAEVTRAVEAGVTQVTEQLRSGSVQPEETEDPSFANAEPTDLDALKEFFTAAMKGVVSSQVQAAMNDPQVQLISQPYAIESENAHQPSLLDYFVPGYSLMFVFFLVSNLAQTVIEERQTGTLRRLLVAPLPRSRILLGKMLPYVLIGMAQFAIVLVFSQVLFGIDLGSSSIGLAIIILASSLSMASLGILIAAFAKTEGQANGLAIVLVVAMAVVSGAMFPTISIPGLQNITPHYWAMQGFLNILARGQGAQGAFLPSGVLLTMSAVFFTLGAIRFRFE